ncbi:hypothetical protein [Neobacillus niacini]|uniref:hypothetical protein n=1 Tax=Neobacillus niacini TaxID=86668 RepID=UPI000AB8593B|nr:hypothetical protein [Neobacillus niacini]
MKLSKHKTHRTSFQRKSFISFLIITIIITVLLTFFLTFPFLRTTITMTNR